MARIQNVRGMLLEEALLNLLESSGYKTIDTPGVDPTLGDGPAGLKVRGRGSDHQIDAIADFRIHPPFSHPQRLLAEAKCFDSSDKVGLPIVHEAVGVLKDVSEHWVTTGKTFPKARYHYQYAIFSATGYTSDAQRYAFAQDIYLIPLAASQFLTPVVEAIRGVGQTNPNEIAVEMKRLRAAVRGAIRFGIGPDGELAAASGDQLTGLDAFVTACREIRFALLAVLSGRFPVFLVPNPEIHDEGVREQYLVRIFRGPNDRTWYLREREGNRNLFSFDLPQELFLRDADEGALTPIAALRMKEAEMDSFQALYVEGETIRVITFQLDMPWLNQLRERIVAQE